MSQDLHQGLVGEEPGQVEIQIERVKKAIEYAMAAAGEAGSNRPHLIRILDRTQRAMEQARAYNDEKKRRDEFKDAFSQIVLLAQAYKRGGK